MTPQVRILELAAWGMDEYQFRPPTLDAAEMVIARKAVAQRKPYEVKNALCEQETRCLCDALDLQLARTDLHEEMLGLDWSLGVVDLRRLLAFQRRLSFNPVPPAAQAPSQEDWAGLIKLAFPPPRPVVYDISRDTAGRTLTLQSSNPNLHLRMTTDRSAPLTVHPGGPFLEVGLYKERWFLRDGYHRAYILLQAGVLLVPAVIVRARTLQELGAVEPWFFPESILLSAHPPTVCDFLDSALTLDYVRPPIIKTLRITMEETISHAPSNGTSGEPA
jgi:hypothetical protein